MIRQKVTVDYFKNIAMENEYFIWHFLMEDQHKSMVGLWSIFETKIHPYTNEPEYNPINTLLSMTKVPYYESYLKDSMDFLMNIGFNGTALYKLRNFDPYSPPNKKWYYVPLVVGFKRTGVVYSTHNLCYCIEGITEIILKLNPELISVPE